MEKNELNDPIQVRALKKADLTARSEVIRRSWEAAYAHLVSPTDMEGLFSGRLSQQVSWNTQDPQPFLILVAFWEQTLAGTASLSRHIDGTVELTGFYVDPDFQGRGIGSGLWQACLEECQKRQIAQVSIWVFKETPAKQFYENRGCKPIRQGIYQLGSSRLEVIQYQYDIA